MSSIQNIRELIIDIIKKDGNRRIPIGIIVRKLLEKYKFISKSKIYETIDKMLLDEELRQLENGKVVLGYINAEKDMSQIFDGIISINSHGDGFIRLISDSQNEQDFFVHKKNLNTALKGDTVQFVKLKKEPTNFNLEEACVLQVVNRAKTTLVARVKIENNNLILIPDDEKFYLNIIVTNSDVLHNNDKVLLKIDSYSLDKNVYTHVIKIIGNADQIGVDVESILYENSIPKNFHNSTINEARQLEFKISEFDSKYRRNITSRPILSIDPATSKDLDDAIYVEKLADGNYFLGVSIADVSYYVKDNTHLNSDALERGTSVYYLNKVIPMLPFNLSDDLCSLNQGELKMCLTCDMVFFPNGDIKSYEVYPAIMLNHARLSYDMVNEFYQNPSQNNETIDPIISNQLLIGRELHEILRKHNQKNGYVDFDIKEPKIILDENEIPIDIQIKQSGIAQKMIEDFMISANECVTKFANDLDLPFIYRVHDKPDIKKYNNFIIEAKKLNFKIPFDFLSLTPKSINETILINQNHENIDLLKKILLRLMQKAKYSLENVGHFGLALENYTHFTSPIRRYSDLIVHRIFWVFVFAKDYYHDEYRIKLKSELDEIIDQCNKCEIRQVNTERDINAFKFAEYMSYKIGCEYIGTISAVVSFGFFVELDNTIEGLVSIKNLDDDFYVYNPETMVLIGRNYGKIFSLGQKVKVRVIAANKYNRKIDFKLI